MSNILIAGCGYVGIALGMGLAEDGHAVWGLRRRIDVLPPEIRGIQADLIEPATLRSLPCDLDFIVYAASAAGSSEEQYREAYVEGLQNLLDALAREDSRPRRIFFTSSTSVYGQSSGEWVDETSPADPEYFTGRVVRQGERLALGSSCPATVIRFGGIYGPGRTRLIESVRQGTARCTSGPPQFTNRIHRDDCAGALRHLMKLKDPDSMYIGVDDEPADQCDVFRWLATRLGVSAPEPGPMPESQTRMHGGSKRCSNARLTGSGYKFAYPTFREGYSAILAGQD